MTRTADTYEEGIEMDHAEIMRRLILLAYERGWRNACDDHLAQQDDPTHPIGRSRRAGIDEVLAELDPNNLLGLSV